MRIAICDDEKVQCQLLNEILQIWAKEQSVNLEVVPFSDAESFLFHWEDDKNFDLLIFDIEMGLINGMELARKIRQEGSKHPILFVTGYESYMAEGYDVEALHYLLKPVKHQKLFEILEKVKEKEKLERKLVFLTEDGVVSVAPSDIWIVEAMAHKCMISTANKEFICKEAFHEIHLKCQKEKGILQVHRSFLVNLSHVASITKKELIMDNGKSIPVSRGKIKEINEAFIRFYC